MAEADRIAAALAYQEQMPAMLNPNLARQGARGRANMMPPTSIMDERYPAFKRNQEDVEKLMLGVDLVGSAIPLAGPAMKGAKVLGQHAAPQIAQALENYTFKTGMALPMDVWHGSPHRFAPTAKNPLGEFDPTKIGTGEGAQAYGYGHYLAESPNVAQGYRIGLSNPRIQLTQELENVLPDTFKGKASDWADAISTGKTFSDLAASVKLPWQKTLLQQQKPQLEKFIQEAQTGGTLYKVDLPDEAVPRMLDWDKPLSQQHPDVQAALIKIDKDTYHPQSGDYSPEEQGQMIYMRLANSPLAKNQSEAAELLKRSGIPGIKYSDAGSRGAGGGTRNFVVFPGNEGLLNILGRE